MEYLNASVNTSATIAAKAGAACSKPAMRAFSFNGDGLLTPAGEGAHAIGIAVASTPGSIERYDALTVQVKDICPAVAGGAFAKGAELMSGADGKLVAATAGKFILAVALEASAGADSVVPVQIVKAGYK